MVKKNFYCEFYYFTLSYLISFPNSFLEIRFKKFNRFNIINIYTQYYNHIIIMNILNKRKEKLLL